MFLTPTVYSQTIEKIVFSSVASASNEFQLVAGSPYGSHFSNTNGSLTISAEYGKSTFFESELSTKEIPQEELIKVFPNPTSDYIHLQCATCKQKIEFVITDANGKQIEVAKNLNTELILDFTTINNGIYFITINADKKSSIFKIIKSPLK